MSPPSSPPIHSLIRVEARAHTSISGAVQNPPSPPLFATKWLSLSTLSYRYQHDPPDTYPRKWDVASRTTRSAYSSTDAVVVLARLDIGDNSTRILLVRQFRPPLRAVSVELPAGLVDPHETVEDAALRELREETGFDGKVTKIHKPASLSPGMTSELVALVEVEVQGGSRGQQLEVGENIEVVSVPVDRFEEALQYMVDNEGCIVKHAVSALAVGMRISRESDVR